MVGSLLLDSPFALRLAAVVVAVGVCCGISACAADCAVVDTTEQPCVLKIAVDQVSPTAGEVLFDPSTATILDFQVDRTKVFGSCAAEDLRIAWYYDENPASDLPAAMHAMCGESSTCPVSVCSRGDADMPSHKVRLVVSRDRLPDGATTSVAFADSTRFDSVEWTIKMKVPCP
jgi:hypothetical protein